MPEAVIIAIARSPIGRAFKGSLKDVRPDDLAATVVRAALDKVPALDPRDIDDLMLGCGLPGGEQGMNMGRVVAVKLGYDFLPGTTITRYCSSSLQTTRMAMHAIRAGEGDVFLSAGVETVSRFVKGNSDMIPGQELTNPVFDEAQARSSKAAEGGGDTWHDPREDGQLPDVYIAMGQTAENLARLKGVTRQEMDEFAARSQNLAEKAIANGFFEREITPVTTPDGTVVSTDDGPRPGTTVEGMAGLKPVFRPDGLITAGNACPLNDGAAAVLVMSEDRARELGLQPLARILGSSVSGLAPEIMGVGPIVALQKLFAQTGRSISDVDVVELNEAFAAQVLPICDEIGISVEDQLNPHGGAIALGHPFGQTGARIMGTLINDLQTLDKSIGIETMCVGGGQGMAMMIERLA